jgi:AraC-like DNA-binding protein
MTEAIKIAALTINVFIFSLLLVKTKKGSSDNLLLIWCIVLGIHTTTLNFQNVLPNAWYYLNEIAAYFHGFLLYLYYMLLRNKSVQIMVANRIIFVIILLATIPILYLGKLYWESIYIAISLKFIANTFFILNVLYQQIKEGVKDHFWILFLIIGALIVQLVPTSIGLANYEYFVETENIIGNLLFCFFLILLGFLGVGFHPVFVDNRVEIREIKPERHPKYSKSNLTKSDRLKIFNEVEKIVLDKELFTIPELTIKRLSNELEYNSNHISESINDNVGSNFNDYINLKRVEAFITKVQNNEHLDKTLLALALECGFNSKSSFNRAFKKIHNLPPSQYISSKM